MRTLFDEMRSEQNLFSAWRHVKRSALNSSNNEIKGYAAEFEHQHQRHLHRIARQLREGRFSFDEVKGVLKDKKKRLAANKDPRPIAVATLKNRVVQRAILQVLQPRKARDERDIDTRYETVEDARLGKINEVNRSKYGVGGLLYPFGGVRPAIELIRSAIDDGAGYFFQSDIKAFFTRIPTKGVVDFIRRETSDNLLSEIFSEGLDVHLANPEELLSYASLFPSGGIGVAQGSSLSAFAGNVLLYDFDHELNRMPVTAVRYIDDLMIVARKEEDLEAAIELSKSRLADFKFDLYKPVPGSDKAARGRCVDAITFLGCTIQPNRCVPSAQSIKNVRNDIRDDLSASKAAISEYLNKGKTFDPKRSHSSALQTAGKRLFGWQRSFSFCTDGDEFRRLDSDIAKCVGEYDEIIRRKLRGRDPKTMLEVLGVPNTERLFDQDREAASKRRKPMRNREATV